MTTAVEVAADTNEKRTCRYDILSFFGISMSVRPLIVVNSIKCEYLDKLRDHRLVVIQLFITDRQLCSFNTTRFHVVRC